MNDAERDQTTSVASSVPRSQASAHQSSGSPRRSATACAAAKVSQIGPQRRNRCARVGRGLVVAEHAQGRVGGEQGRRFRARGRSRSCCGWSAAGASSRSIAAIQPHCRAAACSTAARAEGKPATEANQPAVSKTATKTRPAARTRCARATAAAAAPAGRPNGKALSTYITERFDEFSRSQKDVARYIVDHLDEAAFQTAEELARRANTSSSTVVRFSQALGFEGYPELQQAAIEEYRSRAPGEDDRRARCSTSTTPSSRPRWPPTTPTSRRPSAT